MRVMLLLALLQAIVCGAEIAAWNVPVGWIVDEGLQHPEVKRLAQSPGVSRFIGEGDELWDFSEVLLAQSRLVLQGEGAEGPIDPFLVPSTDRVKMIEHPFEGEWAVWNQSRGLLVVCGGLRDLMVVSNALRVDRLARNVNFSFSVHEDGKEKKVAFSGRSGEEFEVQHEDLEISVAPNAWADGDLIDVDLAVSMSARDDFEANTSVTLLSGKSLTFAEIQNDGVDLKFSLSAEVTTAWGIPLDKVMESELGERPVNLSDLAKWNGLEIEGGVQTRAVTVPKDTLARLGCSLNDAIEELQLKGKAAELVPLRLYDIGHHLRQYGARLDREFAFAGYQPDLSAVIVAGTQDDLDTVESIFMPSVGDVFPLVRVGVSLGATDAALVGRSGEKFSLKHHPKGRRVGVEFAPNVAADGKLSEMTFRVEMEAAGVRLMSAVTAWHGVPVSLGRFTSAGNEDILYGEVSLVDVSSPH